ncbi:TonB-dependent receptor [Lentisalinibacter orientalis]|uniref:TonB-dependent receptor n=1 Tax=Lentisalinibacter orientalis TaxID=2992241 RepID=UPI0038630AB7
MRMLLSTALGACAVSLVGLGYPVGSLAQEGAGLAIEEIVVTARKREESLQEIPIAVSAFDAQTIENRGLQSIDDVSRFTPGLSFSKAFGRATERPVIRGLSNVLAGVQFGVEAGAAYFVDGVYYPGDIQNLDLGDLERVEIIKGPQSALYGRNTYSGAINFVTRSPGDEFRLDAKALTASDGETEFRATVSGPILRDVLGGSLTARAYDYDGEWTNTVTGGTVGDESSRSISGVLDWTPTDTFRLRTRVQFNDDDDGPPPIFLQPAESNNCFPGFRSMASWAFSGSTNNNQYYCGQINPGQVALNTDAISGPSPTVPGIPPGSTFFGDIYSGNDGTAFDGLEREQTLVSLLADWTIGPGYELTASTAFRTDEVKTGYDSDHTSVNFFFAPLPSGITEGFFANTNKDEVDDYSVELRFASPVDRAFRWLVGGFFYSQQLDGSDITFADPDGGPVIDIADTRNEAYFGYIEYDFSDRLTATLEGRYANETKQLWDSAGFSDRDEWSNFTPRATVDYQITEDTLIYGVVAKGVKPGGFNGSPGEINGNPTYEQEEAWNYELGLKSSLNDGRVQFSAAAFFIDAQDIQLTTPVPNESGSALTSIATNQGSGEVIGLELDVRANVTDQLDVGLTYALADSEFTEGCDDFQWTLTSGGGELQPGGEAVSADFTGNGDCSIEGKQFPISSKHQASAFFNWYLPAGGANEWFVTGDVTYESKKYVQVHNLAYAPGATLAGLRVGYQTPNWRVSGFVRNLFDEDSVIIATRWLAIPYISPGFSLNTASFVPGAATGSPRAFFTTLRRGRQIGLEVSYSFGGS